MSTAFFVTGTDTNVGKTWSTVALMLALQRQGKQVNAMKPVAAGCDWMQGGWKNHDALLLQRYASQPVNYEVINPYAFQAAVSPHVACGGVDVQLQKIQANLAQLVAQSEVVLVEGAGGWLSPLSLSMDNADLARALRLTVILVVGMRLGCLNHARLTYQGILQAGLECAGWVAVQLEPAMPEFAANLSFLQTQLHAPMLGTLPYQASPDFPGLARELQIANLRFY